MASHTTGFDISGLARVEDSPIEPIRNDSLAPLSPSSPSLPSPNQSPKRRRFGYSAGTYHDILENPLMGEFEGGWKAVDFNQASTSTAGGRFNGATVYGRMPMGQRANASRTLFPPSPRRTDSSAKLPTINDVATMCNIEHRNKDIGKWLEESSGYQLDVEAVSSPPNSSNEVLPGEEDDWLEPTENKDLDGQAYVLNPPQGEMTPLDLETTAPSRVWDGVPVLHSISDPCCSQCQPAKSQAAIEKFERQCLANDARLEVERRRLLSLIPGKAGRVKKWPLRRKTPGLTEPSVQPSTAGVKRPWHPELRDPDLGSQQGTDVELHYSQNTFTSLDDDPVAVPYTTLHVQSSLKSQAGNIFEESFPTHPRVPSEDQGTGSFSTETNHYDGREASTFGTRTRRFHTRRPRQVGIATIQVQSVSLARQYTTDKHNSSFTSEYLSASSDTEDNCSCPGDNETGRGDAEGRYSSRNRDTNASETPGSPAIGSSAKLPRKGRTGAEDGEQSEEEDEQEQRWRKPNGKSRSTSCKPNLPRFACPYQAFERGRPCLRRSRRNPKGGSDGLGRLKQHLARKHMVSYRCPNCWISLDSRTKASVHEQQKQCVARPKPDEELFMDPPHEGLIERSCPSASEEDAWWWLFKLLIPGMEGRDVVALSLDYSPYFIHVDMARAFMLPAVTFPDAAFYSSPTRDRNDAAGLRDLNLGFLDSSLPMAATHPELTYDLSQTFSVPLFEAPTLPSPSTNDGSSTLSSLRTLPGTMLSSHTSSSSSPAGNVNLSLSPPHVSLTNVSVCTPSSRGNYASMDTAVNPGSMPPPPRPPQSAPLPTTLGPTIAMTRPPSSAISTAQPSPTILSPVPPPHQQPSSTETHLQRTNDRLRKRTRQLETENEGLRQASQVNRADLSRAHTLLEDVLAAEGVHLPGEVYDRLVEVGDLISSCVHTSGRVV
ncbi:uncharacterized protein B0H64DRAFT_391827 [Chaetomium fimeti]|uniref:Uncharacterized protein n=1 Tax=Chaetomium fimeti TaxID=1854472 RepID=A0AAE0HIN1_9PEZI|nr:hypothetical protein B0H64DRAFT_391827 [Chaetomium fimeti]